jgi:ferrous-iron efflux pump FieF
VAPHSPSSTLPSPPASSARAARSLAAQHAGRTAALVAAALALGKLIAGQLGHSTAVTASAVDSLMDIFASSANALAIRAAHAGPDEGHPFGHAKIEALATAGQGLLIGGSGVYILIEGARRVIQPVALRLATVTIGTMIASTIITVALVAYLTRIAKKTQSTAIEGDAIHYRTDIGANLAVLAGVVLTYVTGIERIDGVLSILVAGYVLISALGLLRTGVRDLLDHRASRARLGALDVVLRGLIAGDVIKGFHGVRTRTAGRVLFVEIHIELPAEMPIREAHARGNRVRDAVLAIEEDAQILVHIDVAREAPEIVAERAAHG